MKSIRTIIAAFFVTLFLGAGIAGAFSVDLTYPNETGLPPNTTYATVNGTVDLGDPSIFHFDIKLPDTLSGSLGGGKNFGMDQFFFNTDLSFLNGGMFKNWDPSTWKISTNTNADGFGVFDLKLTDPGKRTDHLLFDIDYIKDVTDADFFILSDSPAGHGKGHFAAHIGGFNKYVPGSTFVRDEENPIPEPGTMVLLGISLLTVAGYMRRMNK